MSQSVCCRSAVTRARVAPRCEAPKAAAQAPRAAASRRAMLSTMVGTLAAVGTPAWALVDITMSDDRRAKQSMESMDRMRDEANDYKGDRHFFQGEVALLSDSDHRRRLGQAKNRLGEVQRFIEAKQWNKATQEIGQALGTARYDMNMLTAKTPDRANRKRLTDLQNVAMRDVETLYNDIRRQDKGRAKSSFDKAKGSFAQAVSAFS